MKPLGQVLYELWYEAMAEQRIGVDEYEDLQVAEQVAWEQSAQRLLAEHGG